MSAKKDVGIIKLYREENDLRITQTLLSYHIPSKTDTDSDSILDVLDQCPNTPQGESVNVYGCSASQSDTDGDNIMDNVDNCSDTPIGAEVDNSGCSDFQLDDNKERMDLDNDGVVDSLDSCPNTPEDVGVDLDGCATLEEKERVPTLGQWEIIILCFLILTFGTLKLTRSGLLKSPTRR